MILLSEKNSLQRALTLSVAGIEAQLIWWLLLSCWGRFLQRTLSQQTWISVDLLNKIMLSYSMVVLKQLMQRFGVCLSSDDGMCRNNREMLVNWSPAVSHDHHGSVCCVAHDALISKFTLFIVFFIFCFIHLLIFLVHDFIMLIAL